MYYNQTAWLIGHVDDICGENVFQLDLDFRSRLLDVWCKSKHFCVRWSIFIYLNLIIVILIIVYHYLLNFINYCFVFSLFFHCWQISIRILTQEPTLYRFEISELLKYESTSALIGYFIKSSRGRFKAHAKPWLRSEYSFRRKPLTHIFLCSFMNINKY